MSEVTKSKAVELSDDETGKVSGGRDYPEDYIPCQFLSKPHGYGFCKYGCRFNGSSDCMDSHHKPSITTRIQLQYESYLASISQP